MTKGHENRSSWWGNSKFVQISNKLMFYPTNNDFFGVREID